MKGNEAFGRAAIEAGCRYFFGYPITPQNELPEYMSKELPNHTLLKKWQTTEVCFYRQKARLPQ